MKSSVQGWRVRNWVSESKAKELEKSTSATFAFWALGALPFFGLFLRKFWGHDGLRRHYQAMLSSFSYLGRAIQGKMAEKLLDWHRDARISEAKAGRLATRPGSFILHLPLSVLPPGLHKFLTDWPFFKDRINFVFVRPIRLYFDTEMREQWLRDMVEDGQKKRMLNSEDAQTILQKIKEPFIQKYLKSLAVHVCTLPVTQAVSVTLAVLYVVLHPEMPRAQAWGIGLGIIALFQVVPISPGSLTRGLYVLYLVIRERNYRDYNIAVFLGFFKYIGYLAFPIQMTYRYPELARFMAVHWATNAVHIVPVFGEEGALLEHWVFRLFYNWPLTIRRRMRVRAEARRLQKARYWHLPVYGTGMAVCIAYLAAILFYPAIAAPLFKEIWFLLIAGSLGLGVLTTLGAGGAGFENRIVAAAVTGLPAGVACAIAANLFFQGPLTGFSLAVNSAWFAFAFVIFSVIGTIAAEILAPGQEAD